jgi:hypothetical protein
VLEFVRRLFGTMKALVCFLSLTGLMDEDSMEAMYSTV